MKYLREYRDAAVVRELAQALSGLVTQPWTIMEICGGQTHAIARFGLDQLLPPGLTLVHGPGCPVCVTPLELIDHAIAIARRRDTVLCAYGDMLRVPGSVGSLQQARDNGADVRVAYSPMDALAIAEREPSRQVVHFAVGFETTAPAHAMAVYTARRRGVDNFSLLVAHVLVPPAIEAILSAPDNRVQGFLAAGHVCAVMGWRQYEAVSRQFRMPIVVTGFEPVDILQGILACVAQLEAGRFAVENAYGRAVTEAGLPEGRRMMEEVFEIVPRSWRGIGTIAASGLALRVSYGNYDARLRFPAAATKTLRATTECIAGDVLRGVKAPPRCPAFGTRCTPEHPLGAPMVSGEGACAAYYRYRSRPAEVVGT